MMVLAHLINHQCAFILLYHHRLCGCMFCWINQRVSNSGRQGPHCDDVSSPDSSVCHQCVGCVFCSKGSLTTIGRDLIMKVLAHLIDDQCAYILLILCHVGCVSVFC